jgi:hypothetical protein
MDTSLRCPTAALVLILLCLCAAPARCQAPLPLPDEKAPPIPQQDKDITILPKGPVHEAFAQPFNKNPQATPIVPKQPPASIPEEPPDQRPKGENVQWIPGYWTWDVDKKDFVWVSGFWRVMPPDRKWTPGYWSQANGGWQWVPGYWGNMGGFNPEAPAPNLMPPPDSVDNGPSVPAPNDDSFYVPGMWINRDRRYVWRAGYWSPAYAGWVWNPAYYSWTPNGAVYVDGFWDYPLADRGLLFAPVYFNQPLWLNAGWRYRPWWTVDLGGLFASLWVRPAWSSYYFGDYYAPAYGNFGFYPWWSYGRRAYDPLWGYYGWHHHYDRGWWDGYRNSFYAQRNVFRGGNVVNNGIVRPLNQYRNRGVEMARVGADHRQQAWNHSQQYRELSSARMQAERSSSASGARSFYSAGAAGTAGRSNSGLNSSGLRESYYRGPGAEYHGNAVASGHSSAHEGGAVHYQSSAPHPSTAQASHGFAHPSPSFHGGSPAVHQSAPAAHGGGHSNGGHGGGNHHK